MNPTVFFRVLSQDDKGSVLAEAVEAVRGGRAPKAVVYSIDVASFRQVSGSPFAYWVTSNFLAMLSGLPRFEPHAGRARRGPSSGDDKRRLRAWWEVSPAAIGRYERWVPYPKGGKLSPYYSDIPIVICWDEKRRTFRDFLGRPGREIERPECLEDFFLPGLTWPRRASRFSPSLMPSGCIFSVRGQAILGETAKLPVLLGATNSWIFDYIFKLFLGRFEFPEFIAGILQKLPWLEPHEAHAKILS